MYSIEAGHICADKSERSIVKLRSALKLGATAVALAPLAILVLVHLEPPLFEGAASFDDRRDCFCGVRVVHKRRNTASCQPWY